MEGPVGFQDTNPNIGRTYEITISKTWYVCGRERREREPEGRWRVGKGGVEQEWRRNILEDKKKLDNHKKKESQSKFSATSSEKKRSSRFLSKKKKKHS